MTLKMSLFYIKHANYHNTFYSFTTEIFFMKEVERHKYCYTRKYQLFIIMTHQLRYRIQITVFPQK